MPGTVSLIFNRNVEKFSLWDCPRHRAKIIESWKQIVGKKWNEVELKITINQKTMESKVKNNRLTPDAIKFIRDNHREQTPAEIAKIIGYTNDCVYRFLRRNNLTKHKNKKESVWYLKEPGRRA